MLEWFRLFVFLFFCIVSILQFGLFFRYDSRFPTFFVLFAFVFEIVMLVHEGLVCFYLICLLYCVFVVFFFYSRFMFFFFFYPKLLMYLCFLCRSLCSSKVARNRVCLCYQRAHFVDFVDFVFLVLV